MVAFAIVAALLSGGARHAAAQTDAVPAVGSAAEQQQLALTATQKRAIYQAVAADKSKAAPHAFPPVVGGDVPPMFELYSLPEVAGNPAVKFYKYTLVRDTVVVVDPTRMRVVDIIEPPR